MVIACNSYQLFTQRIILQGLLGNAVSLVNEQSSSHQTIAEALREFRVRFLSQLTCFEKFLNSNKRNLRTFCQYIFVDYLITLFQNVLNARSSCLECQPEIHKKFYNRQFFAIFQDSAERLAQGILSSVKKTSETLNLEAIYSMEEAEKDLVHTNYVETMHLCFNTGFEVRYFFIILLIFLLFK